MIDAEPLPPEPEQVISKTYEPAASGIKDSEPLVVFVPVQALDAAQLVAFVEDHEIVTASPIFPVLLLKLMLEVAAGITEGVGKSPPPPPPPPPPQEVIKTTDVTSTSNLFVLKYTHIFIK